MSTLAYAALTTKREQSDPKTSTSTSPPGLKTYVDALAALVPAEVFDRVKTSCKEQYCARNAPLGILWAHRLEYRHICVL